MNPLPADRSYNSKLIAEVGRHIFTARRLLSYLVSGHDFFALLLVELGAHTQLQPLSRRLQFLPDRIEHTINKRNRLLPGKFAR